MAGKARFSWIVRVLAAVLLAALSAGCSGLTLGTPAEPVELTFVYLENAANYEPLAQAYQEKHPNVTIKLDPISLSRDVSSEMALKLEKADLVRLPAMSVPDEVLAGILPLDTLLSTDSQFSEEDLFPGSMEGLKVNGKQMGLPAGINPFVVYYSPAKFKAFGLNAPPPDWTLDDFVATATALNFHDDSQMGSDRYGYGFCSHWEFSDSALITYLFGGRLFDSLVQVSRPTLNDPGNVKALEWYANLYNNLQLMPDAPAGRRVGELVYRERCGLWIDWLDRSSFGPVGAGEPQPLPLPRYVSSFNIATEDGYYVLARSEHPEEAFQWAAFLLQEQEASGQLIPPVKKAVDSSQYASRAPAGVVSVARSLPENTVVLSIEMFRDQRFGAVLQAFSQATEKVVKGEADAQSALDLAQAQVESAFK